MRIIQIAQSDENVKQLRKCLAIIFGKLSEVFGVSPEWNKTYILNVSIEKHDDADPRGESWVAVSHSRDSASPSTSESVITAERYFENENMQNEYGQVETVRFNWNNPEEALTKVMDALGRLK